MQPSTSRHTVILTWPDAKSNAWCAVIYFPFCWSSSLPMAAPLLPCLLQVSNGRPSLFMSAAYASGPGSPYRSKLAPKSQGSPWPSPPEVYAVPALDGNRLLVGLDPAVARLPHGDEVPCIYLVCGGVPLLCVCFQSFVLMPAMACCVSPNHDVSFVCMCLISHGTWAGG